MVKGPYLKDVQQEIHPILNLVFEGRSARTHDRNALRRYQRWARCGRQAKEPVARVLSPRFKLFENAWHRGPVDGGTRAEHNRICGRAIEDQRVSMGLR